MERWRRFVIMGRYGSSPISTTVDPKEQARRTKAQSSDVKSWLAIKDTIALQPSTISALKDLAFSDHKIRNNSYDEIIVMLIKTYYQAQKMQQWRVDHPNYV
jgi:hypothetical protein